MYKTSVAQSIQVLLLLLVYPLASYLIYVMCSYDAVKGRTEFGFIMVLVLDIYIYEKLDVQFAPVICVKKICVFLLALLAFLNVRFANVCYAKETVLQSQTISYYTTLISRIQSVEGYSDELPVIYVNEFNAYCVA